MTMIERVANAIAELDGDINATIIARVALKAMREPTESMVEAGTKGVLQNYGGCCTPGDNVETARDVWREMISAAADTAAQVPKAAAGKAE
jgi:hypothetical protein